MDITFVTTANTDEESYELLKAFGMPFAGKNASKIMARKSVIAREIKREKLVAKYAAKRKALKEAGDYEALDKLAQKCFTCSPA